MIIFFKIAVGINYIIFFNIFFCNGIIFLEFYSNCVFFLKQNLISLKEKSFDITSTEIDGDEIYCVGKSSLTKASQILLLKMNLITNH
jgi:hypothetical protein